MNPNPPVVDPEEHDAHLAERVAGHPASRKDLTMLIALILVILSLWFVITARRLLKRLLEPKRRPAG